MGKESNWDLWISGYVSQAISEKADIYRIFLLHLGRRYFRSHETLCIKRLRSQSSSNYINVLPSPKKEAWRHSEIHKYTTWQTRSFWKKDAITAWICAKKYVNWRARYNSTDAIELKRVFFVNWVIQLDREWRRCTSWFHSTDGSCGHKIRAVRPVKEDMAQTMGEAGSGIGKGLSPVLARRSRHFPMSEGGSREPLNAVPPCLSISL